MVGNNGQSEGRRTLGEDGQPWARVAQEMKAVQEDIKSLVANSRQRLLRAVDEEMCRVLWEAMAWLSETSATDLLPQSGKPTETPRLETDREKPRLDGDQSHKPQGVSEHTLVPGVDAKVGEDPQDGAPTNSHASSPKVETLAEVVAPDDSTNVHTGKPNGMEALESASLQLATSGSVPGSDEIYSGTVQIAVTVGQSPGRALHFVDELYRHPSLRLHRLLANLNGVMELQVLLREPTALKKELLEIEGVSQVNRIPAQGGKDTDVRLEVCLNEPKAKYGN